MFSATTTVGRPGEVTAVLAFVLVTPAYLNANEDSGKDDCDNDTTVVALVLIARLEAVVLWIVLTDELNFKVPKHWSVNNWM